MHAIFLRDSGCAIIIHGLCPSLCSEICGGPHISQEMVFGLQSGLKAGTQPCLHRALHKTDVLTVVHIRCQWRFWGAKARLSCFVLPLPGFTFFFPLNNGFAFFLFNVGVCLYNFIYLFLAVLGLRCCGGFSLVAASASYSLVAVCRLLIVVASLVAEHRL